MNTKIQNIFQKITDNLDINDFELKYIASRHSFVSDFVSRFPSKVNLASINSKNTLLHFCSNHDSALLLIDNNAQIDFKNRLNQTPLLICPSSAVADLLIDRGASIKVRDLFGRNQLHFCSDVDKIDYFIGAGVYANSKDYEGKTPLFFSNSLAVTQCLIDNNCNLRIRDKFLNTPLFYLHNSNVLQFLIDQGLNVNATNHFKQNALFFNFSLSAIHIFIRNGININQVDTYGYKAFHYNYQLREIYDCDNIDSYLDSLFNPLDFCQRQILSSEQNYKFNYTYDRSSNSYTLKKFNSQISRMDPSFNQYYLNNNIPDFYSQSHPSQDPSQHSQTDATSDYDFGDTLDLNQLERDQSGGRFLWNDDLLEQASEFMYNNDRNNGLKRTAKKFNVIKGDLELYYNEYIDRMNNQSEISGQSFHGVYHDDNNDSPIDDDRSIYPSDDEEFIKSLPVQAQAS